MAKKLSLRLDGRAALLGVTLVIVLLGGLALAMILDGEPQVTQPSLSLLPTPAPTLTATPGWWESALPTATVTVTNFLWR